MRFAILAALVAAVAATPLEQRAGKCAFPAKTTTVAGVSGSFRGPFNMTANAPGLAQDGYYAHAGPPSIYATVIFDINPKRRALNATTFYLEGDNLVAVVEGALNYVNDVDPTADKESIDDSNVVISTDSGIANKLVCTINSSSCAMACTAGSSSYNCLADPKYQPDWRINTDKTASGGLCFAPFNPVAVPL